MATAYSGYMGKVMLIDLSTQSVSEYPWTDKDRELFIGGKTMAAKILCDHFTGKETAYSEENLIVISTGPLTGTGAPSSSRFNLSTLSPQTGLITSSNCGGSFGYHLKRAGYDALIIRGKCAERSWIEIKNDKFTFHSAEELWGTKVTECQERLEERVGHKRFGRLVIGPAGENLVRYSAVVSEERAAGRTGVGAVFGWKAVFPVYTYVAAEFLFYGIGTWNVCYLYVWLVPMAMGIVLRRMESPLGWAIAAGAFGLAFGALCAIAQFFIGGIGFAVSWWVSGISFDLIHCAGNFVMALALFVPLRKLVERMYRP